MSRFSINSWKKLLAKHINSRALERRGLRHIHHSASLNELAALLADHLSIEGVRASTRLESIWIDGTPQARASTSSGEIQCELADLLVILNVIDRGSVQRRSAVLIQAKVGSDPTTLPSGSSTIKERALLEGFDDTKALDLFRDTKALSPIGSYVLKVGKSGLMSYARYLVMPISLQHPVVQSFGPFVVGWPPTKKKKRLGTLELFRDISVLLWDSKIGSPLTSRKTDEWTRMVEDLLGRYSTKRMKRFGGFDRVERSKEHASMMFFSAESERPAVYSYDPPYENLPVGDSTNRDEPAAVSILSIVVDLNPEHAG